MQQTGSHRLDLPGSWLVGATNRNDCVYSVSERASHLAGGYPVVRQQLGQGAGLLRRQAHEHILQVGVRIVTVEAC